MQSFFLIDFLKPITLFNQNLLNKIVGGVSKGNFYLDLIGAFFDLYNLAGYRRYGHTLFTIKIRF